MAGFLCKTCFFSVTIRTLVIAASLAVNGYSYVYFEPKEIMPQLAKLKAVYIRVKLPDAGVSHMHLSKVRNKPSISREKMCMSLATMVYSLL